jgi:hypothetical protein
MSQFHDMELQQTETADELIDSEPASIRKRNKDETQRIGRDTGNQISARAAILTVAAIGILTIPIVALVSTRAHLLSKLPIFVGLQSPSVNVGSAVLAVDTFGLAIRVKKAPASTQEIFEQVAVQHLARLHRTYSRWAEKNRDLMGSLLLKLTVDATGTVVNVDPLAVHVTNAGFTRTVMDDVRKWKFPKGRVEAAEITVPLLFVPKGMDPDTVVQWERKVRSVEEGETSTDGVNVINKVSIPAVGEQIQKPLAPVPHSDHTRTTQLSPVRVLKPKTEEKALIVVKTNRPVGIRENPRFSAKKIHEVDEDTPLSVLENSGDWLKVKAADAGYIGFVRKEFVSPIN